MPLAFLSLSDWFSMLLLTVVVIAFKHLPAYVKKDLFAIQEQPQHSRQVEMLNPIIAIILYRNIAMHKITSSHEIIPFFNMAIT